MSGKQSRNGEIVAVRYEHQPVREGNTVVGSRIFANLTVRVTDNGSDKDRLIHVRMDPEEMMTWAQRMIEVSGKTQEMRDDIGHTI